MSRLGSSIAAVAIAVLVGGCDIYFFVCDPPDQDTLAAMPERLSQTGLYADTGEQDIADGIFAYQPAYELWSDGASKRRWLRLPPGTVIDTSNMDSWQLPVGSMLWKEFSKGGRPIETRLLERIGPGESDWAAQSYVWSDDGSDAVAAPLGVLDARGTGHNVPAAGECAGCHRGRRSFVLGVSAVQLSLEADDGHIDIDDLARQDLLSHPPQDAIEVPGDATARTALGYLHANCGHCHNQDRPDRANSRCFEPKNDLDFWLAVADLSAVEATGTYRTAVGSVIEPGRPDDSELIDRMDRRGFIYQMPPLGSERIDDDAVAAVRAWVESL